MNQPVYKRRIILFLTILMLIVFNFTGTGCRLLKRDKQATAEKKAEDADKKADAEYDNAQKQHYDHQSKDAKKMMKQTKKNASKYNKAKKRKAFAGTKCN